MTENKLPVIDISHHNRVEDWQQIRAGVAGVYIKATEGQDFVDDKFRIHARNAEACRIPKGFYHFASLNNPKDVTGDARAEARDFWEQVKEYTRELPLALDIETNKASLSPKQVQEWIEAFFDELAKFGQTDVVLYSYAPFLDKYLPRNHRLGHIRLWLAAYIPKPRLPRGWSKYWMWQYTGSGSCPGIKGRVDLNKTG